MPIRMHDAEVDVTEELVCALVRQQMSDLADRPVTIVEPWGTDNAIWRLGDDLVVRLPRIESAVAQVDLEARWLPKIAPPLRVAVPVPVAIGVPGMGYPFPWAVHEWIDGDSAAIERISNPARFAVDVAEVIAQMRAISTQGAPAARGRARPLKDYDVATRGAIASASQLIDGQAATAVWEEALAAAPHGAAPAWVHGDLEGNCLLRGGRLCGLVDWGSACAGDPAVDVQVMWSPLFTEESRGIFVDALGIDAATIARSRGAAINQACAALPYYLHTFPLIVERSWHKLAALGVRPAGT